MTEPERRDTAVDAVLRAVIHEHDPVPPQVVAAARGSFAWRTVEDDLHAIAELVHDSLLASGVRDGGASGHASAPRVLTFEGDAGTLVIEIADEGDRRRLTGQIDSPATLVLRHAEGEVTLETDEHGRFAAAHVPHGPLSARCRFVDGRSLSTSWVNV